MSLDPTFSQIDNLPKVSYSGGVANNKGVVYCVPFTSSHKVLEVKLSRKELREVGPVLFAGFHKPTLSANGAIYALPTSNGCVLEIGRDGSVRQLDVDLKGNDYSLFVEANGKLVAPPAFGGRVLVIPSGGEPRFLGVLQAGEPQFIGPDLNAEPEFGDDGRCSWCAVE